MISTHRDMFAVVAIFLLCLMAVSHSAPLTCEDLVRPLDQLDPHDLEGVSWALVAQSLELPFKFEGSMTMYFSNTSEASVYSYTQGNRFKDDQCDYLFYNFTIENGTITSNLDRFSSLTGSFLYTSCPDCLVVRFVVGGGYRVSADVYLLSKRRQLEQTELDEFGAQMKCLNRNPPDVSDPTKELCPKQTTSSSN